MKKLSILPLRRGRKNLQANKVDYEIKTLIKRGLAMPMDAQFYQQFAGQYWNGVPVAYRLREMSKGWCFDASAILAAALGIGDDVHICRGRLNSLNKAYNTIFHHGWVERDGQVYDTTWQVIVDQPAYYQLFGAEKTQDLTTREYYSPYQDVLGCKIYHREDYESGGVPVDLEQVLTAKRGAQFLSKAYAHSDRGQIAAQVVADTLDVTCCCPIHGYYDDLLQGLTDVGGRDRI